MSRSKYEYFKWVAWGGTWDYSAGVIMLVKQQGNTQICTMGNLTTEIHEGSYWYTQGGTNWKPLTYSEYRKELSNARKALRNNPS